MFPPARVIVLVVRVRIRAKAQLECTLRFRLIPRCSDVILMPNWVPILQYEYLCNRPCGDNTSAYGPLLTERCTFTHRCVVYAEIQNNSIPCRRISIDVLHRIEETIARFFGGDQRAKTASLT